MEPIKKAVVEVNGEEKELVFREGVTSAFLNIMNYQYEGHRIVDLKNGAKLVIGAISYESPTSKKQAGKPREYNIVATLFLPQGKPLFYCISGPEEHRNRVIKDIEEKAKGAEKAILDFVEEVQPQEYSGCKTVINYEEEDKHVGCIHAMIAWSHLLSHLKKEQDRPVHPAFLEEEGPDSFMEELRKAFRYVAGFGERRDIKMTKGLLIWGDSGSGKTYTVKQFLRKLQKELGDRLLVEEVYADKHTTSREIVGNYEVGEDGTLQFKEGAILRIARFLKEREDGYAILFVDELPRLKEGEQDTFLFLTDPTLMEDGKYYYVVSAFGKKITIPADRFVLIATGNLEYVDEFGFSISREATSKIRSEALSNRFFPLFFRHSPERVEEVCKRTLKERGWTFIDPKIFRNFYEKMVELWRNGSISKPLTIRHLGETISYLAPTPEEVPEVLEHFFNLERDMEKRRNSKELIKYLRRELNKFLQEEKSTLGIEVVEVITNDDRSGLEPKRR